MLSGGCAHWFHAGSAPGAVSSAHSKTASVSLDEKLNVAVVAGVMAPGPSSIVVSGGVSSRIVHRYVTAGCSTTSNSLVAWIVNSCSPAARCGYVWPDTHGSKSSPSIEQANVTLGWLASNVNVALRSNVVAAGVVSRVVVGAPITVHVWDAGVGSTFGGSARSTARTSRVC